MQHLSNQNQDWNRQPFTAGEFFMIVGVPISFVLIGCTILFVMVIRAGG